MTGEVDNVPGEAGARCDTRGRAAGTHIECRASDAIGLVRAW